MDKTHWQEIEPVIGKKGIPYGGGIAIIGGGFAGISTAYFLQEQGFLDITIIDMGRNDASYSRNAGHLLVGNGESYARNIAVHGKDKAKQIQSFAETFCQQMEDTTREHKIHCDYVKGKHLYIAASDAEQSELQETAKLIPSTAVDSKEYGFKGLQDGLLCHNSASAHPVKFRNGLLNVVLSRGAKYYSCDGVRDIKRSGDHVVLKIADFHESISNPKKYVKFDAAVICTNAYAIKHSDFFKSKQLIDPFKGQIVVSEPLILPPEQLRLSFNADHGFMYGQFTADSRLLLGGWRNNISGGEIGSFDLKINHEVQEGLKQWTRDHLGISPQWDYSWSGIMGSSSTGLPFVGETDTLGVYCCAGFTGYGFAWAHGSAKVLADIMAGNELMDGWELLSNRK